jgi:hypothetical protein
MSLIQSGSKEALSKNIETEMNAGKPPKQAEAIGYATQRANDDVGEYRPSIVETAPEGLTLAQMNEKNKDYWAHRGGDPESDL